MPKLRGGAEYGIVAALYFCSTSLVIGEQTKEACVVEQAVYCRVVGICRNMPFSVAVSLAKGLLQPYGIVIDLSCVLIACASQSSASVHT